MHTLPILILIALLTACGQAGDLYLPEEKPAVAAPAEPAAPEKADEKKETK